MKVLFNEIEKLLPLTLKSAFFENLTLTVSGDDWQFSVNSAWRFRDSNKMIFGCDDVEVNQTVNEISRLLIISVKAQSASFPVDPVFIFSNGYRLEVFSARSKESWRFELPNGAIIVESPGNPS